MAHARSGLPVTDAERDAKFEALWAQPGFGFWFANFAALNDGRGGEGVVVARTEARLRESPSGIAPFSASERSAAADDGTARAADPLLPLSG